MIIDPRWTERQLNRNLRKILNAGACAKLLQLLRDPSADFEDIAQALKADVYLTAKTLTLANLLTPRQDITTLDRAVAVMGLRQVHALVISAMMMAMMGPMSAPTRRRKTIWRWIMATAVIGRWIDQHESRPDDELTHDIAEYSDDATQTVTMNSSRCSAQMVPALTLGFGLLILHAGLGRSYGRLLGYPFDPSGLAERERTALGVSHHQVSEWALRAIQAPLVLYSLPAAMAENAGEVDEDSVLRGRVLQMAGAWLAGYNRPELELWLADAMPRLACSFVDLDEDCSRLEAELKQLAESLEVPIDVWRYPAQDEDCFQAAGMMVEQLVADNLSLSEALGRSSGEQANLSLAHQRAEQRAHTDGLTGMLNRRGMEQFITDLNHEPDRPIGLVLIDADHFKQLNDSFGHAQGDEALRSLAAIMQQQAPQPIMIARMGGDEFCLLVEMASTQEMEQWIDTLRQTVRRRNEAEQGRLPTISVGATVVGSHELSQNWQNIYQHTDRMLYHAKSLGRNRGLVH